MYFYLTKPISKIVFGGTEGPDLRQLPVFYVRDFLSVGGGRERPVITWKYNCGNKACKKDLKNVLWQKEHSQKRPDNKKFNITRNKFFRFYDSKVQISIL